MKKIILVGMVLFLAFNLFIGPEQVYGASEPPEILAETAVLIDASTGKVLYNKNMDKQMYPASTTKVMTAILALENLDLSKTMVIDAETPYTEGARMYLTEGEEILTEQVLKAMLIVSANDAAVALGKEVGGNIPAFADMMNKKAVELGAKHTNFVNPNGLHEDGHMTTAYDLAMIAKYAMKKPAFRDIVLTYRYIIPATNKQDIRYLYNTNRLIYDEVTKVSAAGVLRPAKYEGATGIKTGSTPEAGGCLISGAKQGDTELIAVVLKSTSSGRFGDSIALLDYGFANFKSAKTMNKGALLGKVKVKRGTDRYVEAVAAEDAYATLPIEASTGIIKTKVVLKEKMTAPISKGQKVGAVEIYEGDKLVGKVDAIATAKVEEGGILSYIGISDESVKKAAFILEACFLIFILLLLTYILIKRRQVKRRKNKKAERLARSRMEKQEAWDQWSSEYDKRDNLFIRNDKR